jgi:hypothetical protein
MTPEPHPPFPGSHSPCAASERRRQARHPAGEVHADLTAEGDPTVHHVSVRNVSPGGIRLVLSRGIEPGTLLHLQLSRPHRNFSCAVTVRVVYVLAENGGDFITGCDFTRPLTAEELRGLL